MSMAGASTTMETDELRKLVRDISDFPKPGIIFKDITPLLRHPLGLSTVVELLTEPYVDQRIDVVSGPESRGFIFASAVAKNLSAGFVPIRKPGRLPYEVVRKEYELEYGTDSVEMHVDSISSGDRVLIVDDLIATGGTIKACTELVRSLGGTVVGAAFLIELEELHGRDRLDGVPVFSVLRY